MILAKDRQINFVLLETENNTAVMHGKAGILTGCYLTPVLLNFLRLGRRSSVARAAVL